MTSWNELSASFRASMSPAGQRNWDRKGKAIRLQIALSRRCPWMRWPFLKLIYTFWVSVIEEGIAATCQPRWGTVTFAFLNDGFSPTLYHTFWTVMGRREMGIYPKGAPRNRSEELED